MHPLAGRNLFLRNKTVTKMVIKTVISSDGGSFQTGVKRIKLSDD